MAERALPASQSQEGRQTGTHRVQSPTAPTRKQFHLKTPKSGPGRPQNPPGSCCPYSLPLRTGTPEITTLGSNGMPRSPSREGALWAWSPSDHSMKKHCLPASLLSIPSAHLAVGPLKATLCPKGNEDTLWKTGLPTHCLLPYDMNDLVIPPTTTPLVPPHVVPAVLSS